MTPAAVPESSTCAPNSRLAILARPSWLDIVRGFPFPLGLDAMNPRSRIRRALRGSELTDDPRRVYARELGAHYPWTRHEIRAQKAGVRAEVIETIRAKGSLEGFTSREKLLAEIPLSLMREHRLSDELFRRAERELTRRQLIEAIALVGHYSTIGFVVNAFDVKAPEGSKTF